MEIRHIKNSDDLFAISRIYERSWKYAYSGIIPKSYLDGIPSGKWVPHLDNAKMNTLVAVEKGEFIGTASYCKSRFSDFKDFGEIVSIYFLPEYMGKGYGKKLIKAVIEELMKLGYRDILLWVLEDNKRARVFFMKRQALPLVIVFWMTTSAEKNCGKLCTAIILFKSQLVRPRIIRGETALRAVHPAPPCSITVLQQAPFYHK